MQVLHHVLVVALMFTAEKITQEKINRETEYFKIHQNQCTDKVVDVTVVIQEQVSPDSNDAQTELEKEIW